MFGLVWKSFHLEVISYYKWEGGNWSHRGEKPPMAGLPTGVTYNVPDEIWTQSISLVTASILVNVILDVSAIYIFVCVDISKFCLLSVLPRHLFLSVSNPSYCLSIIISWIVFITILVPLHRIRNLTNWKHNLASFAFFHVPDSPGITRIAGAFVRLARGGADGKEWKSPDMTSEEEEAICALGVGLATPSLLRQLQGSVPYSQM